jgi:hypothetical protein
MGSRLYPITTPFSSLDSSAQPHLRGINSHHVHRRTSSQDLMSRHSGVIPTVSIVSVERTFQVVHPSSPELSEFTALLDQITAESFYGKVNGSE